MTPHLLSLQARVTDIIFNEEKNMEALLILVIVAALLALGYAAFNFIGVKNLDEGTDRMKEIAAAIRVGANAFITYEYKIIAVVVVIIAIAFAAIFTVQYGEFSWEPSVCFMIGVIMSASAGWVGMKIATYANVRVSNTARNTKNIGSTLKVALKVAQLWVSALAVSHF